MRVAFPLIGGADWTGGRNYLFNLIRAVAAHCPGAITPVVFFGTDVLAEEAAPFSQLAGVDLVQAPAFDRRRRLRSLALAVFAGTDGAVRRQFAEHRIDLVFEDAQFYGKRIGIPTIAWLPDFQHRHLPGLFSRFAWLKRELGFRAQMAGGRTVMLSSRDACRDCERFYPASRNRLRQVRFAVPPPAPIGIQEARSVADGYGLPEKFFYLPNQFWVHKNHLLVAEALGLLRQQGRSVVVAASGNPRDPRRPEHYPRLCERIEALGLKDDFRLLGMVPYAHLGALMQACNALLNPSLFEGWSTTVVEAQSLGVPLILSDLAVHREQAGDGATYFDRSSATALAEALAGFRPLSPDERERRRVAGGKDAELRVKTFAEEFVALATNCCRQGER